MMFTSIQPLAVTAQDRGAHPLATDTAEDQPCQQVGRSPASGRPPRRVRQDRPNGLPVVPVHDRRPFALDRRAVVVSGKLPLVPTIASDRRTGDHPAEAEVGPWLVLGGRDPTLVPVADDAPYAVAGKDAGNRLPDQLLFAQDPAHGDGVPGHDLAIPLHPLLKAKVPGAASMGESLCGCLQPLSP